MGVGFRELLRAEAVPLGSNLEVVHLGRQAIYDASLHSRAYELFYRSRVGREAKPDDADRATCSVVLSAFAELGLQRVASDKRVFLNVAHDVISGALPLPVSPSIVVLQVRDYEHSAGELVVALRQRRAEGYQVALDGFVFRHETAPLLEVADYLKFNVRRLGLDGLAEQLQLVRGFAGESVACKIDTSEQFNRCVTAGCDYFQGRFLFRPQVLSHKRLPKGLKTITRLLSRLRDPAVELAEIERIVKTDAALTLAVLRFLGSAAYALPNPVTSVAHAVTLLGLREFSKWVTVIALTSTTVRPSELCLVALIRARASELVAAQTGADPDGAFMVGLMSGLEALFERSLPDLLDELPVADEIRVAVLEHGGVLGKILADVVSREDDEAPISTRFDARIVTHAWLEAVSWATDAQRALA